MFLVKNQVCLGYSCSWLLLPPLAGPEHVDTEWCRLLCVATRHLCYQCRYRLGLVHVTDVEGPTPDSPRCRLAHLVSRPDGIDRLSRQTVQELSARGLVKTCVLTTEVVKGGYLLATRGVTG